MINDDSIRKYINCTNTDEIIKFFNYLLIRNEKYSKQAYDYYILSYKSKQNETHN